MARKGRLWQVDEAGFLMNDASLDLIASPFSKVVDDGIQAYLDHIGDDVHSIYVTGSVARGLAVEGQSDLNMIALLEYYTEPELVMQDWVGAAEEDIASRQACVAAVQMEIWPHGWVLHDESEFSISAFILKSHAVCVWGADITPDLTTYQFTDRETRLAIANDDIVQLEPDIDEAMEAIDVDPSPENVRYWCQRICKHMIHAAFGLVMPDEAVHTRDIDLSVAYFAKHFPDYEPEIKQAEHYIQSPTEDAQALLDFLDTFGAWLLAECEDWLDQHNPDRYIEYQFEPDEG